VKKIIRLATITAGLLLAATQANAIVVDITYQYFITSNFTRTIPMPSGVPSNPGVLPPTSIPVFGTGTIDTTTGDITLNPINYELVIASGSTGYVDWSQTLNGSFSGNDYLQSGVTVNGGSLVCADPGGSGCIGGGGVGALPGAIPMDDTGGFTFTSLTTGGTATYVGTVSTFPNSVHTIQMELGGAIPIPGAAWLFGSGLLGLVTVGRKRRKMQA